MIVYYAIPIIFVFVCICGAVKAIREKKYTHALVALLAMPFMVFTALALKFGGSAFNDAANSYPLYQQGHYYLSSHGVYTEVSHDVFSMMRIVEIIGHITFFIGFIGGLIVNKDQFKSWKKPYQFKSWKKP